MFVTTPANQLTCRDVARAASAAVSPFPAAASAAVATEGTPMPSCILVRTTSAGCVMSVAATAATVPEARLTPKEGHCLLRSLSCKADFRKCL